MLSVSGYRGVVPKEYEDDNQRRSPEDLVTYLVVRPDQLVLNTMWLNYCGLGVSGELGLVSPAYRSYNLGLLWHPPFLHHLSRCLPFVGEYTRLGYGIRPNSLQVSREDFAALPFPLPPLPVQRAIADFLDRKTAAIDGLIEKKQKLLGLLAEKRAALINQAVTKGLDPSVPMKDSGIEWCPTIPTHWEVPRNKELLRIRKEPVGGRHADYQQLSLTKQGIILRDVESRMGKYLVNQGANQEVRQGDLVFCFFDVEETPRTVGLSRLAGMISPDYTVLDCVDPRTAAYLELFYIAMDDRKLLRPLYTGLRKRISKPCFLSSRVPLPPPKEVARIIQYIHDETRRISCLIVANASQAERLQEYRQALITAAVTGQLDIEGAA